VLVDGTSLASGAKVGIVAHGTLVPVPDDVGSSIFGIADRSIAINTVMFVSASRWGINRFINRDEAVSRVYEASIRNAIRAVIPIGAVETLVANAIDRLQWYCQPMSSFDCNIATGEGEYLIAAIADGIVVEIPARAKKCLR
jgi:hypothetical protein